MAVTVKLGEKKVWKVNVGVASNGTRDHNKLGNRDAPGQHPMSAIPGLESALMQKAAAKDLESHVGDDDNPHGVTAEQVGARPNTWMPTIEQIGAAPSGYINFAGAVNTYAEFETLIDSTFNSIGDNKEYRLFCAISSSNGAVPAGSWFVSIKREWAGYGVVEIVNDSYRMERKKFGTWGAWANTSPSAFAPASGFESYHDCASVDELNAKIVELTQAQPVGTEKTYYIYLMWHYGITLPTGRWSVTIHKPYVSDPEAWASVTATVVGSQTVYKLHRELYAGTWLDWAWENPPKSLGVEYRTTERWNSKAVYTILANIGALPNSANGNATINCTGAKSVIRDTMTLQEIASGRTFTGDPTLTYYCGVNTSGTVYCNMKSGSNLSAYNGIIQLWYTKD